MKRSMLQAAMLMICIAAAIFFCPAMAEEVAQTAYTIDLTSLFQAALTALAALVTGYLIPWLKAKAGNEKQELTNTLIDVAVYAAQQLYETDAISDRLDYACSWLKAHGVTVDRAQVEAGVKRYKTGSLAALVDENLKESEKV